MLLLEVTLCEWYSFPIHGCPSYILVAFGSHAVFSPVGCGSLLYSITMTLSKSLIVLLIFCWLVSLGIPYVKL